MFILRDIDPAGAFLIPQASHAWLAWQLADHWGNRHFPRPAPRAEVLAAVLHHDGGWGDFDVAPELDGDGRPVTFDRMPVAVHLAIWRRSIAAAAAMSRYAGLLVASHFLELLAMKHGIGHAAPGPAEEATIEAFRGDIEEAVRSWRADLQPDPRYQGFLAGPGWTVNAGILAVADRISVYLCAGLAAAFTVAAPAAAGVATLTLREVAPRRWRVQPWPFRGDRVRLQCEGRRLTANRFATAAELAESLRGTAQTRLAFTLERPSAVGKG